MCEIVEIKLLSVDVEVLIGLIDAKITALQATLRYINNGYEFARNDEDMELQLDYDGLNHDDGDALVCQTLIDNYGCIKADLEEQLARSKKDISVKEMVDMYRENNGIILFRASSADPAEGGRETSA